MCNNAPDFGATLRNWPGTWEGSCVHTAVHILKCVPQGVCTERCVYTYTALLNYRFSIPYMVRARMTQLSNVCIVCRRRIHVGPDWPIPYGHFQLRWFCICILQGGSLLLDRFCACLTEPCKVHYEKFSKKNNCTFSIWNNKKSTYDLYAYHIPQLKIGYANSALARCAIYSRDTTIRICSVPQLTFVKIPSCDKVVGLAVYFCKIFCLLFVCLSRVAIS